MQKIECGRLKIKAERIEKSVNTKRDTYLKRISNYDSGVEQMPAFSL